jgi:putative addiction module killer protein
MVLRPGCCSGGEVSVALTRLGQGNLSKTPKASGGTARIPDQLGPGYRVYFGRDGEALVILLTGGTKKCQGRDIEYAKALGADYKRRRKPPAR